MSSQEKNWTRITVVWMALAYVLVSGFWLVWYLVAGEIPALRELMMRTANEKSGVEAWIIPLPFVVSRAWDAFLAPLFVFTLCRLWRWAEKAATVEREEWVSSLAGGLVVGLVVGLAGGLVFGLVVGLGGGLVFGLVGSLAGGLVFGLVVGAMVSTGFGCVAGWGFTLIIWLPLLAVCLVVLACRRIRDWFRASSDSRAELKKLLSGQT